jgi:hypothetical protein
MIAHCHADNQPHDYRIGRLVMLVILVIGQEFSSPCLRFFTAGDAPRQRRYCEAHKFRNIPRAPLDMNNKCCYTVKHE